MAKRWALYDRDNDQLLGTEVYATAQEAEDAAFWDVEV